MHPIERETIRRLRAMDLGFDQYIPPPSTYSLEELQAREGEVIDRITGEIEDN